MKPLSLADGMNVLSAWTAIEILSPQTFKEPKDLANKGRINLFEDECLPWENGGEQPKPDMRLAYQVVVGSIDFKKAIDALIEKYGSDQESPVKASGEAIIAVLTLDQKGCPVDENCVMLSSFAWGLPQALKGDLKKLSEWPAIEKNITKDIAAIFRKKNEKGEILPLNKFMLDEAYHTLIDYLEISHAVSVNRLFSIRSDLSKKNEKPPNSILLNSFYVNDLQNAKKLISEGKTSENLFKYLGIFLPESRHNVMRGKSLNKIIENAIAPRNIPPSRWPAPGRHPLTLLQQAAVNLALSELKEGGVFSVNGPPGTGKTTLLRDIVAGIVTQRAQAMMKFEDPEKAFIYSGSLKNGNSSQYLYRLDESLKGFEILITSANNKAVENITAELPSINAIADDAINLRYFNSISDKLLGIDTWGLIAAVLGNKENRSNFCKYFWNDRDKDQAFSSYLAEVAGIPQFVDVFYPGTQNFKEERSPEVVLKNNPPKNRSDALKRWKEAREKFKLVLDECQNKLNDLENMRKIICEFNDLKLELKIDNSHYAEIVLEHDKIKPSFIARFLRFSEAVQWKNHHNKLLHCYELSKQVRELKSTLQKHFIDEPLLKNGGNDIQHISPWCDASMQLVRDNVFIEAMHLSKAFIDASAEPLLNNLRIFMEYFNNKVQLEDKCLELLPDLWSSLFIVVPVVSTTFASIGNMLQKLAPGSLGWLIIDEAGQAIPQAAVGAVMRTQRTITTGDPLQILPIVNLPEELTKSIFNSFGTNLHQFNAPAASVQTLADAATPYFAEFKNFAGVRTVGFPLLVHRRCTEPMFSISNAIAYNNLMVQAKKQGSSLIRDCLGQSGWFDVCGQPQGKWCLEEGQQVIALLSQLKEASIYPDIYILSPFREVADNMRNMIRDSGILKFWSDNPIEWMQSKVGTVHTAQGREAEAVIFILGAPALEQLKSRQWAGKTPNLLNVAITRAKEALYIVGNRREWKEAGVFKELHNRIPVRNYALEPAISSE